MINRVRKTATPPDLVAIVLCDDLVFALSIIFFDK